jgi:hypothetical protein
MDTSKFDCLTRSVATTGRRGALKAVAGAALGAVGVTALRSDALAQCITRGNPCAPGTEREQDRSCCTGGCRGDICRRARLCR